MDEKGEIVIKEGKQGKRESLKRIDMRIESQVMEEFSKDLMRIGRIEGRMG